MPRRRDPLEPRLDAEAAALRRLAVGLLRDDPELADEVTQRAHVSLWRGAGSTAAAERPAYARGVLRHIVSHVRRDERRRRERELEAGRARVAATGSGRGTADSTADALARHEIVRRVAAAVASLREPFREAVVLRFYEGLPPRRIARRLGVPVATVRSRVQRGLAALRADLDRGGATTDDTWRLGLAAAFGLPLGQGGAGSAASASVVFWSWIMSKSVLSMFAAAASAALLLWLGSRGPVDGPHRPTDPNGDEDARRTFVATPTERADPTDREPSARIAATPPITTATPPVWRVRVVDAADEPILGATVFAGPATNRLRPVGRTRDDGRAVVTDSDAETVRFVVAAGVGHRASTPRALAAVAAGDEIVLVLAHGAVGRVVGRILDPSGLPLADVRVSAGRNEPPSAAQRARGFATRRPELSATTAADGTFTIDGVAAGWLRFSASHPDFAPLLTFGQLATAAGDTVAELRLEKRLRFGTVVTGRVVGLDGRPVADASIRQGSRGGLETRATVTAADGTFRTAPLVRGQRVELLDANGRVRASVRVPKAAEPVFVWNPILGASDRVLRGRVIGAEDAMTVRVGRRRRPSSYASGTLDASGRFTVLRPRGRDVRIGVFARDGQLPVLVQDVVLDDDAPDREIVLELPATRGTGRVRAALDEAIESIELVPETADGGPTTFRARGVVESGAGGRHCAWRDVPAGRSYRVVTTLGAAGRYTLARFAMPVAGSRGGGEIDLGTLAPPRLVPVTFRVDRHASARASTLEYLLERVDDNAARVLDDLGPLPPGPHALPAGRYRLDVELSPGTRRSTTFDVAADDEAIDVPVRIDARRDFGFVVRGLEPGESGRLRITRLAPTPAPTRAVAVPAADPAVDRGDAATERIPLAGGRYRVVVAAAGGRRASVDILVPDGEFATAADPNGAIVADERSGAFVLELE